MIVLTVFWVFLLPFCFFLSSLLLELFQPYLSLQSPDQPYSYIIFRFESSISAKRFQPVHIVLSENYSVFGCGRLDRGDQLPKMLTWKSTISNQSCISFSVNQQLQQYQQLTIQKTQPVNLVSLFLLQLFHASQSHIFTADLSQCQPPESEPLINYLSYPMMYNYQVPTLLNLYQNSKITMSQNMNLERKMFQLDFWALIDTFFGGAADLWNGFVYNSLLQIFKNRFIQILLFIYQYNQFFYYNYLHNSFLYQIQIIFVILSSSKNYTFHLLYYGIQELQTQFCLLLVYDKQHIRYVYVIKIVNIACIYQIEQNSYAIVIISTPKAYPYIIYIIRTHSKPYKMFFLLPCATIRDKVTIPALGDAAKLAYDCNKTRQVIKQYSNVQYLLKKIQEGEVIMTRKVEFDNYLKAQVQLMRGCVYGAFPCAFSYTGYMDPEATLTTAGLSTKEQWAIEMVMSRYTINSIYHAAAFSSLQLIFKQTASSFQQGYKNSTKLITNLQITFKYFNQGWQPLKRLSQVYPTLELLFSKNNKQVLDSIIQIRKQIFLSVQFLVSCNLAYLKLEKYRLMTQYRSCKQLAYSVYNLVKDTKTVLTKSGLIDKIHPDMRVYINIAQLFFLAYCYYFLLEQHQDLKNKQDYGFIKKQFQQMIVQNCVVCQQFIKIAQKVSKFPNKQNLDNLIFADGIIQQMLIIVRKRQYAYGINIHENKQIKVPTIDEVLASRVAPRNLWNCIATF